MHSSTVVGKRMEVGLPVHALMGLKITASAPRLLRQSQFKEINSILLTKTRTRLVGDRVVLSHLFDPVRFFAVSVAILTRPACRRCLFSLLCELCSSSQRNVTKGLRHTSCLLGLCACQTSPRQPARHTSSFFVFLHHSSPDLLVALLLTLP